MAEVGKAYVQIIPSAKGIKGSITNALKGESVSAGQTSGVTVGNGLVSSLTKTLAAAGIGAAITKAISSSLSEGAALQQSIGGIETLYKENADAMIKYAKEAYKTAGLSANEYMETVTGFSASLLQSLGGDTKKAGDVANQAVIDMSDNANKMGTSMESIQNAYQGFAKQNYTMLDNLKLGYGGTKSEMERLLQDAEKLTGIHYDIDNFSDVVNAIHAIQDNLDITGTTAKEAASTFTGSFNSMKSAAKNLLGEMSLGGDISDEVNALAETIGTFLTDNFIPMVGNIFNSIPDLVTQAIPYIKEGAEQLLTNFIESVGSFDGDLLTKGTEIVQNILDGISQKIEDSEIFDKAAEVISNFATGLIDNLPDIITASGDIVVSITDFITEHLPDFFDAGTEILNNIADALDDPENIQKTVDAMSEVLDKLVQTIENNGPEMVTSGGHLIVALANGVMNLRQAAWTAAAMVVKGILEKFVGAVGKAMTAGGQIVSKLATGIANGAWQAINAIKSLVQKIINAITGTDWWSIGSSIIEGITSGVGSGDGLFSKLRNIASGALSAAKGALAINSPSKVFRDQVGKAIPEGIAVGVELNADMVDKAVADLANPKAFNTSAYMPAQVASANYRTAQMPNMTINVYPSEGMDERKLADYVAQSIYKEVRRRGVAFA